jgi:iron complex transport system permease protein
MCIVVGGGYLLAVDTLCRAIGTAELPLGILTALLGAPFFIFVLARRRQAWF